MWTEKEAKCCQRLIELAISEDLSTAGDVTSQAIIAPKKTGRAAFVARAKGVVVGLPVLELVFQTLNPELEIEFLVGDGTAVKGGQQLAVVSGPLRALLSGERIALNFLQKLSGIATLTRQFVDAVAGSHAVILDTRKTTPGWRVLEKYAVREGGGRNHRMGLYDGILIKDNHLAAFGDAPDAIEKAVAAARNVPGAPVALEIEVDTLEQLEQALACHPDLILLDNMTNDQLRAAVARRNAAAPKVLLEASGGVSLATVAAIAATGVDHISVGALTHSAPALDIGLDYEAS